MRHPLDIAIMFTALWMLASMILDILTPAELTVYMIAAAIAPAMLVTSLLYYLRFPLIDFMIMFATLWLLAAMTIEWITPTPLSPLMIVGAFAPAALIGAWLHVWPTRRKVPGMKVDDTEVSTTPLGTEQA